MSSLRMWALLSLVAVAACTGDAGNDEAAQRRMEWSRLGIQDYSITRQRSAFAFEPPIRITVQDNTITAAVYVDDGKPVPDGLRAQLRTINGTFDLIDEERDRGADQVEVTYDPVRNFPAMLRVDPQTNATDDEFVLSLSDFAMP